MSEQGEHLAHRLHRGRDARARPVPGHRAARGGPGDPQRRARRGQDHPDPGDRCRARRARAGHLAHVRDRAGAPAGDGRRGRAGRAGGLGGAMADLAAPRPSLVHADAYRLGSALELDDLDLDTDTASSVTVVEWGEGLAEGLAADRLEIAIAADPPAAAARPVWRAKSPTQPWTCRVRCGFPWSARAGKASSCPSRTSLIVYSSALYRFRFVRSRLVSRSPNPTGGMP